MLEARDLGKAYGDLVAVDGVSFALRRGELLGLVGPNGAGKTTTVSMIAGLVPPSDHTTTMAPQDVTLASGSNAVDAGLVLPNLNDDSTGSAPDLRALEHGCPVPLYGVRPEGIDETAVSESVQQMAAAWARHLGGEGVRVFSGGSDPAAEANPAAVAAMNLVVAAVGRDSYPLGNRGGDSLEADDVEFSKCPPSLFAPLGNGSAPPFRITCPHCAHGKDVPLKFLGETVRCPKCKKTFAAEWGEPMTTGAAGTD